MHETAISTCRMQASCRRISPRSCVKHVPGSGTKKRYRRFLEVALHFEGGRRVEGTLVAFAGPSVTIDVASWPRRHAQTILTCSCVWYMHRGSMACIYRANIQTSSELKLVEPLSHRMCLAPSALRRLEECGIAPGSRGCREFEAWSTFWSRGL